MAAGRQALQLFAFGRQFKLFDLLAQRRQGAVVVSGCAPLLAHVSERADHLALPGVGYGAQAVGSLGAAGHAAAA
jgi:hypothetical protein